MGSEAAARLGGGLGWRCGGANLGFGDGASGGPCGLGARRCGGGGALWCVSGGLTFGLAASRCDGGGGLWRGSDGLAFPTSVVLGCHLGGGWLGDSLPLVDLMGGGAALRAASGQCLLMAVGWPVVGLALLMAASVSGGGRVAA